MRVQVFRKSDTSIYTTIMLRIKALYRIQAQRSTRNAVRHFSRSVVQQEEVSFAKEAAAEINSRRVAYKKQVSLLRKEYASEVALQRAADQAEEASKQKEEQRRSLERRRRRNIKAAESSVRELERRRRRELEFQEELRIAQINRDARNERFRKARQLLVDELEAEAPLWLTTAEEVDAAFNNVTEQELWALPNSFIGAPLPTEDAKFWNFETHTWHMDRTYQTQSESLVEDLMEQCYNDANIDKSYWTPERLKHRQILQDKARLRGMVREAGRRALLVKQRELMQDMYQDGSGGEVNSFRRMPVPNVKLLADLDIMESEGVKVLFNDPTKFFEFDKQPGKVDSESSGQGDYDGPTLGAPRGLKNDVKVEKTLDKAYPAVLGRLPRPDTRTAKEKKRDEREKAMLDAALKDIVERDAFDGDELLELSKNMIDENYVDDDKLWEEGLDPEKDKHFFNVPSRERFFDSDVDEVIEKLEKKLHHLVEELDYELDLAQQQAQSTNESERQSQNGNAGGEPGEAKYSLEVGDKVYDIGSLGLDTAEVDNVLESLTDEQMVALHIIDREMDTDAPLNAGELRQKLVRIPGLTAEQIDAIVGLEEALASSEPVRAEEALLHLQGELEYSIEGDDRIPIYDDLSGSESKLDSFSDPDDELLAKLDDSFESRIKDEDLTPNDEYLAESGSELGDFVKRDNEKLAKLEDELGAVTKAKEDSPDEDADKK